MSKLPPCIMQLSGWNGSVYAMDTTHCAIFFFKQSDKSISPAPCNFARTKEKHGNDGKHVCVIHGPPHRVGHIDGADHVFSIGKGEGEGKEVDNHPCIPAHAKDFCTCSSVNYRLAVYSAFITSTERTKLLIGGHVSQRSCTY